MSGLNSNAIRMSSMKIFLKFDFSVLVFFIVHKTEYHHFGINPEDLITTPELKKLSLKIKDTNLLLCCILDKKLKINL